jgi:hypothetical protein
MHASAPQFQSKQAVERLGVSGAAQVAKGAKHGLQRRRREDALLCGFASK